LAARAGQYGLVGGGMACGARGGAAGGAVLGTFWVRARGWAGGPGGWRTAIGVGPGVVPKVCEVAGAV
jgi:hypothetical protein